jgi:hypothetical protein
VSEIYSNESERLRILEMIDSGVITAGQGLELLKALRGAVGEDEPPATDSQVEVDAAQMVLPSEGQADVPFSIPPAGPTVAQSAGDTEAASWETLPDDDTTPVPSFDADMQKWRDWMWIPLAVGISITALSGLMMYWALQSSGFGFWFACAWFPLLLGVLVISLAATSRTTRWLHIRIHQKPGEFPTKIALSFPLPLRLSAWFLRIFRRYIHTPQDVNLEEIILALRNTSHETPFYVQVNEEDGERVEVYIG